MIIFNLVQIKPVRMVVVSLVLISVVASMSMSFPGICIVLSTSALLVYWGLELKPFRCFLPVTLVVCIISFAAFETGKNLVPDIGTVENNKASVSSALVQLDSQVTDKPLDFKSIPSRTLLVDYSYELGLSGAEEYALSPVSSSPKYAKYNTMIQKSVSNRVNDGTWRDFAHDLSTVYALTFYSFRFLFIPTLLISIVIFVLYIVRWAKMKIEIRKLSKGPRDGEIINPYRDYTYDGYNDSGYYNDRPYNDHYYNDRPYNDRPYNDHSYDNRSYHDHYYANDEHHSYDGRPHSDNSYGNR